MTNKEQALETIRELVSRFDEQLPTLKNVNIKNITLEPNTSILFGKHWAGM
jgi:hypothetical protein